MVGVAAQVLDGRGRVDDGPQHARHRLLTLTTGTCIGVTHTARRHQQDS